MALRSRVWARLRRRQDASPDGAELTEQDRELLRRFVKESRAPNPRTGAGRPPTDDELVLAAWADLAIEEPDLKFEEARRVILGHA